MNEVPEVETVSFDEMEVGQTGIANGFFHQGILASDAPETTIVAFQRTFSHLRDTPVRKVILPSLEGEQVPCLQVLVFSGRRQKFSPSEIYLIPSKDAGEAPGIQIVELQVSEAE